MDIFETAVSEMVVPKVKMMNLSESWSHSFPGSMDIVFHLQFNLPSSSFLLLCQFLTHPDCTFATELTIILSIIRYGCRKKEGVESLRCEI